MSLEVHGDNLYGDIEYGHENAHGLEISTESGLSKDRPTERNRQMNLQSAPTKILCYDKIIYVFFTIEQNLVFF